MGSKKLKKSVISTQTQHPTQEKDEELQYSFDEIYKAIIHLLLNGTKEQQEKVWKQLNEGKGDWVWMKMKIITDAYSAADAKAREEFSLLGINQHLKNGYVTQLEDFTDEETGIKYRQYKRPLGLIWRVPYATDDMDKYSYEKALNKKFLGDFIELQTAAGDEITLIPLDTIEKVKDYNGGGHYYQNHPLYKDTNQIVLKAKNKIDNK